MAPMHIGYGSPEVQIVAPRKISGPCSARQWRIATISPCAVGSLSRLTELRPRPSTRPSLTITAPNGVSASAASAMASRISAISVVVTLLISSLAVAIKRFDRTPGKDRLPGRFQRNRLYRLLAIAFEHQVSGSPNIDLRYHATKGARLRSNPFNFVLHASTYQSALFEFANSIRSFSSTRSATWLRCNV